MKYKIDVEFKDMVANYILILQGMWVESAYNGTIGLSAGQTGHNLNLS